MESDVFDVICLLSKNEQASEHCRKQTTVSLIIPPKIFQAGIQSKFSFLDVNIYQMEKDK